MAKREQTWDELERFLGLWTFGPQMTVAPRLVRHDDENYAVLYVYLHTPNSYEPGFPDRHTGHEFVVPVATYNYQTWRRWVYDRMCAAALHEVGEWFMDDGERVFAPHHGNGEDPYVQWQTRADREAQVAKAPGDD